MLVNEAIHTIVKNISHLYSYNESQSIAKIAVKYILSIDNLELSLSLNKAFPNEYIEKLFFILERLKKSCPIQYITGQEYFLDLLMQVSPSVLIPRPETQELVSWLIEKQKTIDNKNVRLLDIATGSGCIAIAIKKYLPQVDVYACDISEAALEIAIKNAKTNNVNINFFQANVLSEEIYGLMPKNFFDIIISNPPYVLYSEKKFMHKNVVDYEPGAALFVKDNNPLIFYNAISDISKKLLKSKGELYLEINENFASDISYLLKEKKFKDIVVKKDIFGILRIIRAILC